MIHWYKTTQILCSTHANNESNRVLCARPHVIMVQSFELASLEQPPPRACTHAFHRVLNGLKLLDKEHTTVLPLGF